MPELSGPAVAALVAAALLVGFAKTAVGGAGLVSVALFAAVLPARASTGALLPLLLVGDVVAVLVYRRHVDWPALVRLIPSVAAGVLVGAGFMAWANDAAVRRTIGAVLLALVGVHLAQRHGRLRPRPGPAAGRGGTGPAAPPRQLVPAAVFGGLAGFTTMVANAGGPVMALYLLAARLDRLRFLGTTAWFFLVVNSLKVPFSLGLGLITAESLLLDAALVPAVLLGAVAGRLLIGRIGQQRFEQVVLVATVASAANLLR